MDGLVWIKITQLMSLLKRHRSPERHLTAAVWQWWGETSSSQFVPASSQSYTGGKGGGGLPPPRSETVTVSESLSKLPPPLSLHGDCRFPVTFISSALFLFITWMCWMFLPGGLWLDVPLLPGVGESVARQDERKNTPVVPRVPHRADGWQQPPHTWMSPQRGDKY